MVSFLKNVMRNIQTLGFKKLILVLPLISLIIYTGNNMLNIIIYSLGIIPLAFSLGNSTSELAEYLGEKKGGFLAATIGNIPEIIMGLWSLKLGMITMAKSALIGSIVNNLLLVLGLAILLGGIKHSEQRFHKKITKVNFLMLIIALIVMIAVGLLSHYEGITSGDVIDISFNLSIVLIIVYIIGMCFSLMFQRNEKSLKPAKKFENKSEAIKLILKIAFFTVILYFLCENLIENIQIYVENSSVSQGFIGIIVLPLLSNIGENISAIMCALKNKMNASLEIAVGSSIQVALLVTPILTIASIIMGFEVLLLFSVANILMMLVAAFVSFIVFADGKTNWFEGIALIAVYIIVVLCYYYVA